MLNPPEDVQVLILHIVLLALFFTSYSNLLTLVFIIVIACSIMLTHAFSIYLVANLLHAQPAAGAK